MERVNVPGTVSGRLRSSAPYMRRVRMNDMIRQRHLRDGILKAQGTSTFARDVAHGIEQFLTIATLFI